MSLVIERFLVCDDGECESNTSDDGRVFPNGFILRQVAKKKGWHTNGTHDWCPRCWKKLKKDCGV